MTDNQINNILGIVRVILLLVLLPLIEFWFICSIVEAEKPQLFVCVWMINTFLVALCVSDGIIKEE
jgi:hypothetical protein